MRTTPWRRTTLQLRQIFLTEAPTFMILLRYGQLGEEAFLSAPSLKLFSVRPYASGHRIAGSYDGFAAEPQSP